MELNTTEVIGVAISVMVVILSITAITMSLGEPSYMHSTIVMWPR